MYLTWVSRVCTTGPVWVGDVHADKPASRAIVRARKECQGSLTITAEFQPRCAAIFATAWMVPKVSLPSPTAITLPLGTPWDVSHLTPASASVYWSPAFRPPPV